MKIIGIDPGYAILGWGIVSYDGNKFLTLDYGAITTDAKFKFSTRLEELYYNLKKILKIHKPNYMAIEKLFFSVNKKTAIDVAQARGVTVLAAKTEDVLVFEYAPVEVKNSITGYGRCSKKQVMDMVKAILNLKCLPKPDDVADALALAVAHAHCSFSRMFNLKENLWFVLLKEF